MPGAHADVEKSAVQKAHSMEEEEEGLSVEASGFVAERLNSALSEDLLLSTEMVKELRRFWAAFLRSSDSREAAGEAIYAAILEAAPSLQKLFKTPRAVISMRFLTALGQLVEAAGDPAVLKVMAETLAFQHLHIEVTEARVSVFMEAILEVLQGDSTEQASSAALDAFRMIFQYVGGTFSDVRRSFAPRLTLLATSWQHACRRSETPPDEDTEDTVEVPRTRWNKKKSTGQMVVMPSQKDCTLSFSQLDVPRTFADMVQFNAVVMGNTETAWMNEVLESFDVLVNNIANPYRFQEECDVISLRLAKHRCVVDLAEFRSCMMASLRSLLPEEWDSAHEVAWNWLWENVERLLKALLGKPKAYQRALTHMLGGLGDSQKLFIRTQVYASFFQNAPSGMDHFKVSTARLHFVAERIIMMTLDVYRDPGRLVQDLSMLGLRHVGYGVPAEMCGSLASACVQVVRKAVVDSVQVEAFAWALSLISRILSRVITEGATLVMRAINKNDGKQLRKALDYAPRCKRAAWTLHLTVGSQSISPLMWAIENCSLDAAAAILQDLVVIRGDRDRYYFGVTELFARHPDIVGKLCADAPKVLPILLDGLIWRSRLAERGRRRAIYFVGPLLVGPDGKLAKAIQWLTDLGDPKIASHPAVVFVTDLVWDGVVVRTFIHGKTRLLITLAIFVLSQSILSSDHIRPLYADHPGRVRAVIIVCRLCIYVFSLGGYLASYVYRLAQMARGQECNRREGSQELSPVCAFLGDWQDVCGLLLTLVLLAMLATEPLLYCIGQDEGAYVGQCDGSESVVSAYRVLSMCAIFCYSFLLKDLSNFATGLAALVLAVGRVLPDFLMYMCGWAYVTFVFASAIAVLQLEHPVFLSMGQSCLTLLKVTMQWQDDQTLESLMTDWELDGLVTVYVILTYIYLFNLLVAMLNCTYSSRYEDMLGFARLRRGAIIVEEAPRVPAGRWEAFVRSLALDKPCKFVEGDLGLAGGIELTEPANLHTEALDTIRHYGGHTSPDAKWPQEFQEDDHVVTRLERTVAKAMKRVNQIVSTRGTSNSQVYGSTGGDSFMSSVRSGRSSDQCSSIHEANDVSDL